MTNVQTSGNVECDGRLKQGEKREEECKQEQEELRQDEQEQREQRQAEQGQNTGQEQSKQGKQVRFDEEEQLEEMRTETAEVVMDGVEEVRSGRGRAAGLVRGEEERHRTDETRQWRNEWTLFCCMSA